MSVTIATIALLMLIGWRGKPKIALIVVAAALVIRLPMYGLVAEALAEQRHLLGLPPQPYSFGSFLLSTFAQVAFWGGVGYGIGLLGRKAISALNPFG